MEGIPNDIDSVGLGAAACCKIIEHGNGIRGKRCYRNDGSLTGAKIPSGEERGNRW